MSWIKEAGSRLLEEFEQYDPSVPYKGPMCLYAVSKEIQGDLVEVDHHDHTCSSGCVTMKHMSRLEASVTPGPCDSPQAASLDGTIAGEYVAAFENTGDERGVHGIRIKWLGGGSEAAGFMAGINNAGTHRPPLTNCEDCAAHGHMEGRFRCVVVDGNHQGCMVIGSYAIRYDASAGGTTTSFDGTLEGSIVCDC